MDLQIRGNDVTVTERLRSFANGRASALERMLSNPVDAKLELKHTHHRVGKDQITAQMTIHLGRAILRAEEHDPDAQRAIDKVMDKMTRQVRRFHERRADRHGPQPGALDVVIPPIDVTAATELDGEDEEEQATLVRTKRFAIKPMDPDEAIDQMELLGHDFFLFHNAEENRVSLIYRRRDGSYGLLVPEYA